MPSRFAGTHRPTDFHVDYRDYPGFARGEDAGKILNHDMVVPEYRMAEDQGSLWTFIAHPPVDTGAVAAWITQPGTMIPIQATGGWLDP